MDARRQLLEGRHSHLLSYRGQLARFDFAAISAGLLLLGGAGLKGAELTTTPVVGSSRWFGVAFVEFELVLAILLLTGLQPPLVQKVALATFAIFASVSGYHALVNDPSCGCFGSLRVSPWVTMPTDVAVVALLARAAAGTSAAATKVGLEVAPSMRGPMSRSLRRTIFVGTAIPVALCAPVILAFARIPAAALDDDGNIVGSGNTIALEPRNWIGKRLPLLSHIDMGERLQHGDWLVVLYNGGCAKCRAALGKFAESNQATETDGGAPPCARRGAPVKFRTYCGSWLLGALLVWRFVASV